jgi:protein SCO1/2
MRRPALIAILALGLAPSAHAQLSRAALAKVGVHPPSDARAPLALRFDDQDGRSTSLGAAKGPGPGVLVFADYRCNTLCGPALAIVAAQIRKSTLSPGRDFRLLAVSINPRATPADAQAMRSTRLAGDPALLQASSFLIGRPDAIATATRALGYGYAYDPANGQYTHPVAAFVLAPDGRLTRVLSEVALTAPELQAAVRTAASSHARPQPGDLIDQLSLLCHGLVAPDGRNDAAVLLGLRLAALATLAALAGGLAALIWRRRRVA